MPRRRVGRSFLLPLALLLSFAPGAAAQAPPVVPTVLPSLAPTSNPALPRPRGLVPQVEFWKAIYSRVGRDEVLFHDRLRLDMVYGSMLLPEAETAGGELLNQALLETRRGYYRSFLRALAEGFDPDTLAGQALRIYRLWGADATPGAFARAAEDVRWQRGLRERFIEGLALSGRYQPHIEQVFREESVPLELTFLPFVESMYDMQAYSRVGAAGIWQFMPGTARLFMRVDGTIDERLDPIRAARAAARLLRRSYDVLGTWPLAITAYNHGLYGMKNAVRSMGTRDIERIVKGYRGRGFGFASRNFYAEFLAALEVRRNFATHFGDVRLDPALQFDEVTLPVLARFSRLAQALEIPVEALWDMNPAFTPTARSQDRPIPAGQRLRLPRGVAPRWGSALASIRGRPERSVARREIQPRREWRAAWYVVRPGDTLSAIAERHGLSLSNLRSLNRLPRNAVIHPGQRLKLSR